MVLVADQTSKQIMLDLVFNPPRYIEIGLLLNIVPVWNSGMSFGMLADGGLVVRIDEHSRLDRDENGRQLRRKEVHEQRVLCGPHGEIGDVSATTAPESEGQQPQGRNDHRSHAHGLPIHLPAFALFAL